MAEKGEHILTRRELVSHVALGWGSLLVLTGISIAGLMKYFLPAVLYEPPASFKIGLPESFPEGVTAIPDKNVFIIRQGKAFHAISSVCTHLRCQVAHVGNGFQCPCHGSKFDINGSVTKGAAPEPLAWYEVRLAENGEIRVNTKRRVKPGTEQELMS